MSLRKIEKVSFAYAITYYPVWFFHWLFYRKFKVVGRKTLPKKTPMMFLANHNNALMDALAILYGYRKPVGFLARADIFKNKKIAKILYFFKIMPVFRPRDGMENMAQNDFTFRRSVDVLRYCRPMSMFPEGMFNPYKNLAPFKKGFARIACMAEDASDWKLNLHIVPVGLNYSDRENRYGDLIATFGKAIPVAPLMEAYKESPNKAYRMLIEQVHDELSSVMIDIRHTEYHDTYLRLFEVFNKESIKNKSVSSKTHRRFLWQQSFVKKLDVIADSEPVVMEAINGEVNEYFGELDKAGVNDRLIAGYKPGSVALVLRNIWSAILSVVYYPMMLIHILPLLGAKPVLKKIIDPQFISSIRFVVWMVLSVLYYGTLLVLVCCFTNILWIKLAFIPAMILHGVFIQWLTPRVKMSSKLFRMLFMSRSTYANLTSRRTKIITTLKERIK